MQNCGSVSRYFCVVTVFLRCFVQPSSENRRPDPQHQILYISCLFRYHGTSWYRRNAETGLFCTTVPYGISQLLCCLRALAIPVSESSTSIVITEIYEYSLTRCIERVSGSSFRTKRFFFMVVVYSVPGESCLWGGRLTSRDSFI